MVGLTPSVETPGLTISSLCKVRSVLNEFFIDVDVVNICIYSKKIVIASFRLFVLKIFIKTVYIYMFLSLSSGIEKV